MSGSQAFSSLLTYGQPWLAAIFLLSLRLAAAFLTTPLFHAAPLPGAVRMLMVAGLAIVLSSGLLPVAVPPPSDDIAAFTGAAIRETVLGGILGLGVLLAFGMFSVAGRMIDIQISFGMGQVLDPVSRQRIPVITAAFNQVGVSVFFFLNAHHAILRGIVYSIECFPIGAHSPSLIDATPVLKQAGSLFSLGFALAAPVAFAMFLVEFFLGVIARSLPQANLFATGVSVKIMVGLAALAFWFTGIGNVMTRVYDSITESWGVMCSQAGPAAVIPESGERVHR